MVVNGITIIIKCLRCVACTRGTRKTSFCGTPVLRFDFASLDLDNLQEVLTIEGGVIWSNPV